MYMYGITTYLFLQESEIKLLTENLKYVSKERDQLRLGLDNAR